MTWTTQDLFVCFVLTSLWAFSFHFHQSVLSFVLATLVGVVIGWFLQPVVNRWIR